MSRSYFQLSVVRFNCPCVSGSVRVRYVVRVYEFVDLLCGHVPNAGVSDAPHRALSSAVFGWAGLGGYVRVRCLCVCVRYVHVDGVVACCVQLAVCDLSVEYDVVGLLFVFVLCVPYVVVEGDVCCGRSCGGVVSSRWWC